MSTNAYLAKKMFDGRYKVIYLHSDGYPEYAQQLLNVFYTDTISVNKLLNHGACSVLGAVVGGKVNFSDNNIRGSRADAYRLESGYAASSQCIFYNRDRGDELMIDYLTIDQLSEIASNDYVYTYEGNTWKMFE